MLGRLVHNPDSKELVAGHDWDLMLSGHTHGGQVLVPFQGPRFAPVREKRFVAGLWSLGGVRLVRRPEVSVLELVGAG